MLKIRKNDPNSISSIFKISSNKKLGKLILIKIIYSKIIYIYYKLEELRNNVSSVIANYIKDVKYEDN